MINNKIWLLRLKKKKNKKREKNSWKLWKRKKWFSSKYIIMIFLDSDRDNLLQKYKNLKNK